MIVSIPVSVGELVDKITILIIKEQNAKDEVQLLNIKKELVLLQGKLDDLGIAGHPAFEPLLTILMGVNSKLWHLEDDVRVKLRAEDYGDDFVFIAKSIHATNDERSQIKKQINTLFNSEIVEEKIY